MANMAVSGEEHVDRHMVGPHEAAADHGGDLGHDDHGHDGGEALGPLDLPAWGAAILGIALGSVVVAAFVLAAG